MIDIFVLEFMNNISNPLFDNVMPFIKHSFDVIINHPISYSFPSGHTASSFTVLGIFLFGIKKYRVSCFILAFLIAFSRLYLGVHYFTDVLGGAVLGLVDAYLVYRLYLRKQLQT